MEHLDLGPFARASGTVRLPGSKSISNRVLLLAALASGETSITNLLDSDDTRVMLAALETLGVARAARTASACIVTGTGGAFPSKSAELFLGNAGTAVRPLTAALAVNGGEYRVHGVPRMHERPIGDLVDGLRQIGARDRLRTERRLSAAADSRRADRRRQADPRARRRVEPVPHRASDDAAARRRPQRSGTIEVEGELISKPYVDITIRLMERFGVTVERDGWARFTVPAGAGYRSPGAIMVEGDASSASYFLAAGAIGGGPVRVEGVGRASIQGDVGFADALNRMGANVMMGDDWIEVRGVESDDGKLAPIDMDFNLIPDAAMTIAVAALFAERHDHAAQYRELAREGNRPHRRDGDRAAQGRRDGGGGRGLSRRHAAGAAHAERRDRHLRRSPHGDVLLARRLGGVPVRINDPECVDKTFPDYFDRFATLVKA